MVYSIVEYSAKCSIVDLVDAACFNIFSCTCYLLFLAKHVKETMHLPIQQSILTDPCSFGDRLLIGSSISVAVMLPGYIVSLVKKKSI